MEKQEKLRQMMDEMEKLLEEINLENIVLANFVEEKGLLPEYEIYKQEIESARLEENRNLADENYSLGSKKEEERSHRDRKPVRVRLP